MAPRENGSSPSPAPAASVAAAAAPTAVRITSISRAVPPDTDPLSPPPTIPAPKPERRRKFTRQSASFRRHVTVSGILAAAVEQRWAEFGYDSFSPFAVEMVCFDLRKRVPHRVSLPISRDTLSAQEAVDRELVRHYRPHSPRNGPLRKLLEQVAAKHRHAPPPASALETAAGTDAPEPPRASLAAARFHVRFPGKLQAIIEERWRELGYESLSAYVTGLVRYDLMLSGPHKYFDGTVSDPKDLAILDDVTLAEYLKQGSAKKARKILLDYWMEEIAGTPLRDDEKDSRISEMLSLLKRDSIRNPGSRRSTA